MLKKLILSSAIALSAMTEAGAGIAHCDVTSILGDKTLADEIHRPLTPHYIDGAIVPSWKDNWFVNISGGVSSFIGSPIGCEDLFGRMKPTLQISIGKWHTPAIGNRISFQGFEWKSGGLMTQKYRHWHADLLWNVMSSFNTGNDGCRWDIVPFVGLGIIDNRTADRRPFAINYGVQGRFRIVNALHVTAELGNATTFKDSDGIGSSRQFGDNLLSLSAGVSWTFGSNTGWKKVIDASPYIRQNERLAGYAVAKDRSYLELRRDYDANVRIIAELRKILDIEGLLDKYIHCFDSDAGTDFGINPGYPVNDYSGLNSLRKRLRENKKSGKDATRQVAESSEGHSEKDGSNSVPNNPSGKKSGKNNTQSESDTPGYGKKSGTDGDIFGKDYLAAFRAEKECLGAPIFFFFKLGTADLVDSSQKVNLNEIARIAIKYGLRIVVTGAADSLTGTVEINNGLGQARASFIATYLAECGVESLSITVNSDGGIDKYAPNEANRNTVVRLFLE